MLAGDAAAGAGAYAPSRLCTELPVVGSDRGAVAWVKVTKELAGILLLVCRALMDSLGEEERAAAPGERRCVADFAREAEHARACVRDFFEVAAVLLRACMAECMRGSKTACLYSLEGLVASCIDDDGDGGDGGRGLPESWTADFDASVSRTGRSIISLLETLKRDVRRGRLDEASLHRLNGVIVITIFFRAYAVLLLNKVQGDAP